MIGTNECSFRLTDGPVIVPGGSEATTAAVTDEYGNPIEGERNPEQEAKINEFNNRRKSETTTAPNSIYTGNDWTDNSGSQWTDNSESQWTDNSESQWTDNSGSQWTDNSGSQWTDNSGSQWTDNSGSQWTDNSSGSYDGVTQWSGDGGSNSGVVTTDNSGYQAGQW